MTLADHDKAVRAGWCGEVGSGGTQELCARKLSLKAATLEVCLSGALLARGIHHHRVAHRACARLTDALRQGSLAALGGALGKELGGDTNNLPKDERKEFGKLGKEFGKLGGLTDNSFIKERSLAASQACETCTQCSRLLTSKSFWPEDWRHRTKPDLKITCKECCPTPPKERLPGWVARSRKNSIEAAARPITCQACARNLPRTQFRPNRSKGKFDFRKPQTCEQCRAEGKHPTSGPKRMRSA